MKTFETEYIDSLDLRCGTICGYKHHGENLLGVMGYKNNGRYVDYELVRLDDWDKEYVFPNVSLKNGEIVARIDSDTCRISDQKPLVKINLDRGLIYFLDHERMNGDDTPIFETRGIKALWIKIIN